jgi:hypothetical protein
MTSARDRGPGTAGDVLGGPIRGSARLDAVDVPANRRDVRYRAYFARTLDWVWDHQADWRQGEWHGVVDRRGRPSGNKAEAFKTPYHNGRGLLRCLELLNEPGLRDTPAPLSTPQPNRG